VLHSIKEIPSLPEQLAFGDTRRTILWTGIRGIALGALGLLLVVPPLVIAAQARRIDAVRIEALIDETAK
jgi:hypothetical protein